MAGAKRRTPYRKQVTDSVLYEYPEPTGTQLIVRVVKSHGSNILEVQPPIGDPGLAMLPTKFRKLVWVKRGDFIIVSEAAAEYDTAAGSTGRVKYLVDHILYADQVKHLRGKGLWPPEFDAAAATASISSGGRAGGRADRRVPMPGEDGEDDGEGGEGAAEASEGRADEEEEGEEPDLWVNPNRRRGQLPDSDDDDDDDDEEEEEEEDGVRESKDNQ